MKMKRFTIDMPEELHTFYKIRAAQLGITMKDLMIELLEELRNKEVVAGKDSGGENKRKSN